MNIKDVVKDVENIIKKRELVNTRFNHSTYPQSPIVVIYGDEAAESVHGVVVDTLKSAWMSYDQKVVFAKPKDNKLEFLGGISGAANGLSTLFLKDYSLSEFDYNNCTVFSVVSSKDIKKIESFYEKIKEIDSITESIPEGRNVTLYLIALLDAGNKLSAQIKREFEQTQPECITGKKVFIIENRSSNGADLTDEESERKLFKNISYIMRLSQLQGIRISDELHLVGSQEVYKPYYEMAAGTVSGVIERVNYYVASHMSDTVQKKVTSETVASELGFDQKEFEYISQRAGLLDSYIPTRDVLQLMPLIQPQEPQTDSNADAFNRQTMGAFYAYVDSIYVNAENIVSVDSYAVYLKSRLSCFDIIRDFGDEDNIKSVIENIKERIIATPGYHLPPFQYIKHCLMSRCTNELLNNVLQAAAQKTYDEAKQYVNSVSNMCRRTFSHGKDDVFKFYRDRTYNKLTDSDLATIGKIGDPEQWLISIITNLVNSDKIYSLSLEGEFAARMGSSINQTVVDELKLEEQYFTSKINYSENIDVAGSVIFMDAQSTLWANIKGSLGLVTIFDMPENSEINIMKIYTYKRANLI